MLIAPPDNVVTVAFLDTFEFLPDQQDAFPEQHERSNEA